jgi:hypothetical protein
MNVGSFTIHVQKPKESAAEAKIISLFTVKKLKMLDKTVIIVFLLRFSLH